MRATVTVAVANTSAAPPFLVSSVDEAGDKFTWINDSKIDINGPMSLPVITGKLKMKKGSNFTFAVPEDRLSTDKGEDVVEFEDSLKLNSILSGAKKKVTQKLLHLANQVAMGQNFV